MSGHRLTVQLDVYWLSPVIKTNAKLRLDRKLMRKVYISLCLFGLGSFKSKHMFTWGTESIWVFTAEWESEENIRLKSSSGLD